MTEEELALLTAPDSVAFPSINEVLEDNPYAPVTWVGKSLTLDSTVGINVMFHSDLVATKIYDYRLEVSYVNSKGEQVTEILKHPALYNESKNYYSFTFSGLKAAELRTTLSMRIVDISGRVVTKTLVYNPATYGRTKTGDLLTLCQALFAYSDAAKAYFG